MRALDKLRIRELKASADETLSKAEERKQKEEEERQAKFAEAKEKINKRKEDRMTQQVESRETLTDIMKNRKKSLHARMERKYNKDFE